MVRITHLASGDLWAGAENQLYNLVLELRRTSEVDVDVILMNEGVLAERLRLAGVPVAVFPESRLGVIRLLANIRRHLAARRTHILHTHRYKENVLGALAAASTPATHSIRTVHGASEFSARSWQLHKRVAQWLDWFSARFLQSPIVCVSAELRNRCARSLPSRHLRIVANGVDIDALLHAAAQPIGALPGSDDRFRIGFFGRLMPVKRVDVILAIAALLEREAPGQFGFYLFGEGPLRASLEEQARDLGLDRVVHFMGFASHPAPWLASVQALLVTSDHEGLPMIVLEAMALGVPVISHSVGAIPEVLNGGALGTLVGNQEPYGYAQAIRMLRDAPDAARARASRASKQVASRYSVERTAREYILIYEELLDHTRRG